MKTNEQPDVLSEALSHGESLIAQDDQIRTAISKATIAANVAAMDLVSTKEASAAVEADFIMDKVAEDELETSRAELSDARTEFEQRELAAQGLRG
jgi:ribosomal protein L16 Arg81 hydroxylase